MSFVSGRKAPIWKYFKDTDPPAKDKAKCSVGACGKVVSCKNGGTTNVKEHLRVHHPVSYTELLRNKLSVKGCEKANDDAEAEATDGDIGAGDEDIRPESSASVRTVSSLASDTSTPSTPVNPRPPSAFASCSGSATHRQQKLDSYRPIDGKQKEKYDMAVAYYIVSCMRPLNTVDKPGFRLMVRCLNAKYEPPSRRTLTEKYIPKLYLATKENVQVLLKQSEFLALTTDIWTSAAHTSYISLTAHFLDSEWILLDVTLNCKFLKDDHTGEVIKDAFLSMLSDWNIDLKNVSGITSDNGENVRLAVELLGGQINHIRCFSHTVNNGITEFVGSCKVLEESLRHAHDLRSFLSSDKIWRHYVIHVETKFKVKPTRLPAPCKTRWWVDLHLAEAVLAQFTWLLDFGVCYSRGKYFSEIPSRKDVSILKAYVKAMKPIEKICTFLCAQKYVTSSLILPMIYLIDPSSQLYGGDDLFDMDASAESTPVQGDLANEDDEESIPLSEDPEMVPVRIQGAVVKKLKKRFKPELLDSFTDNRARNDYQRGQACLEALVRCSYLDPRFRSEILPEDRERAKDLLLADIASEAPTSFMPETQASAPSGCTETETAAAVSAVCGLFKKRRLAQATAAGGSGDLAGTETTSQKFQREVVKYELLPPEEPTTDPFQWWKTHRAAFPLLSRMARKYLIIPASSVPSERLFSKGGDIITDTRSSLTGDNAEMLIFCSKNQKFMPLPK